MKQVIQLDTAGYFVGFTTADESPLEPGVFLLPAGAIDVQQPTVVPEGKRMKWAGEWIAEDIPQQPGAEPPPPVDPIAQAKLDRAQAVAAIIVTTASGKQFDGNEEAQTRMARAIAALTAEETTLWVLADNTVAPAVTREELREALRLAGAAQTAIWASPYQP